MKKILASLLAITMLMTTLSACIIPASAAENPVLTEGFTEDFEGYGSGNWLTNLTDKDIVDSTKITNMGENDWTVYAGQRNSSYYTGTELANTYGATVEVVADPDNANNKVLKIDPGTLGDSGWIRVRRNSNGGAKISRADMNGKKMVIKAKFKLPDDYKSTSDTSMLTYDPLSKGARLWINPNMTANYGSTGWSISATGSRTYNSITQAKREAAVATGEWFEIKYVLDLTENKTEEHPADTYRGFYNGSIYTHYLPAYAEGKPDVALNSKFPQPSRTVGASGEKVVESWGGYITDPTDEAYTNFGDFYGVSMTASARSNYAADYMYMDDIQVYYINPFKQEDGATFEKVNSEGIWYEGEIRIPFNNNLMTVVKENGTQLDYKTLFTLKDAEGNAVEGGIANAYADGKELVIELNKAIERNVSYTISADPLFMDEEGQGLNQFSKSEDLLTFDTAVDPFAHIYFNETFEDYKVDGVNWTNSVDGSGFVTGVEGVGEKTFVIGGNEPKNASVKVVADPLGTGRGNVLEISTGAMSSSKYVDVRRNLEGGNTVARSTMDGKRIVIEGEVYVPSTMKTSEDTFLSYSNGKKLTSRGPKANYTSLSGTNLYIHGGGSHAFNTNGRISIGKTWLTGEWKKIRYVFDVSEPVSKTHVDTSRAYFNDIALEFQLGNNGYTEGKDEEVGLPAYPLKEANGERRWVLDMWPADAKFDENANLSAKDFYGIMFNLRDNNANNQAYYIDNLKAYYIEDLKMTKPDLTNYTGGTINIAFNQPIKENVSVLKTANGYNAAANATEYALEDLISVCDKDGNKVEGVKVKLSADAKTVMITPGSVESNNDYTIVIDRRFRDIEGQGINNNNTETELALHVGDFVPFAFKGISQDTVSGFISGRDVKVTVEFTLPIDESMVKDGIVVTNSKGQEIPYGTWTYEYVTDKDGVVDNKQIVLNFSNLATDDYIVTTDADFAIGSEALEGAFTLEIKQAAGHIVLFEENFDTGYTFNENWMSDANAANAADAGYTTKNADDTNYQTADGKWDIQADGTPNANEFVGVVDATNLGNGFSGGALKLYNDRATKYNTGITMVRRNFDEAISLTSGEYEGKILVYEADLIVLPRAVNMKGGSIAVHGMKVSSKEKAIYEYANTGWKNIFTSASQYRLQEGAYSEVSYGPNYWWQTAITTPNTSKYDTGANLKLVVDQSSEKDTMRIYCNGELVTRPYLDYLKGHARNGQILADAGHSTYLGQESDFGDTHYGIWNSAGDALVYIDNFKAYLVDNFEIESVTGNSDVFNTAKATVDYTFTKPVNPETVSANVKLVDEAGKEVSDGIKSVTVSDAGYKLTVKLGDTLPGNTKYAIVLGNGIEDTDGLSISKKYYYYNTYNIDDHYVKNANGNYDINITTSTTVECIYTPRTATSPATLKRASDGKYETPIDCYLPDEEAMKTKVYITTSKAQSLFAEAEEATVNGTTVTTNVVFTNPEVEEMEVLCFIAVYGKYNEMIGCQTIKEIIPAGKKTDNIPVSITTRKSDIGFVKMYVWNNETEMDPYHNAEILYK